MSKTPEGEGNDTGRLVLIHLRQHLVVQWKTLVRDPLQLPRTSSDITIIADFWFVNLMLNTYSQQGIQTPS